MKTGEMERSGHVLFRWLKHCVAAWFFALCLVWSPASSAQALTGLTIEGTTAPGIVGEYSLKSDFSWIQHLISSPGHSWMFGPGSMGGIVFGTEQSMGQMGGWYTMYNQPAVLFSATGGITIDANNTIDMSNLRLSQAWTVFDLGSGSGYDTFVPLVNDISLLGAGENGWMINPNGTYYLAYNSVGLGPTTTSTIYLYGSVVPVPLPGALVFFMSGMVSLVLTGFNRRFHSHKS